MAFLQLAAAERAYHAPVVPYQLPDGIQLVYADDRGRQHTVDLHDASVLRDLIAEGWTVTAEDLAVLSPYLTAHIQRFGVYSTDEVALAPGACDAHLDVVLELPATG